MKKFWLVLAMVGAVQGCSTGGSYSGYQSSQPSQKNYQLTDARAGAIVVADVLTQKCISLSPEVASIAMDYRRAASRLLSVATVNQNVYDRRYNKLNEVTDSKSKEEMKADCDEFIPKIANMIPEMNLDYHAYLDIADADRRRESQRWNQGLEMLSSAFQSMGQSARSYNYDFIPMPSGRVTFGQSQKLGGGYNHYLVNTPSGQQQCHVASSGYIFCN